MLKVKPLHSLFVGEVSGIDLRQPVDPETVAEIVAAIDRHAVLIFHGQFIDDKQQLAFSRLLGPLETTRQAHRPGVKLRLHLSVSDVSNLDENNRLLAGDDYRRMSGLANRLWHTDSSFKRTPAKYSLLSARALPSWGGETEFADLRAAYDALPERKKREIEHLVAEHSIETSRAKIGFTDFTAAERAALPPVPQVLVRKHPGSGRKTLYLASHAGSIQGMRVPEARMLLQDLTDHATQPQFVYRHSWQRGDLVIWDNRCTMHRQREFDLAEVRDMHRTTVADVAPTLEQEGRAATAA
jgi:alpha-ketoglutarate-dependent 2,4-dichlorophenoxyacetate dioxygenase